MSPTNRKCTICGFVVAGEQPPAHCPECGARDSMFTATEEPPHGIPHNPLQPHDRTDNFPLDVGPGATGCFDTD